MFTGIISDIGRVEKIIRSADWRVTVSCNYDMADIAIGDSVACDGVCLTVAAMDGDGQKMEFAVSQETISCTTIGGWEVGRRVNLEQALRVGDKLGGHFVSGHVDCVAAVIASAPAGDSRELRLELPADIARFVAAKGSVTVNGVSLTVNEVAESGFLVNIIPHTQEYTNLGQLQPGDMVNLEADIIARYLARQNDMAA